ncbi:MAG: TerB family tellurite resistance protein [Paludibacteraceae bacterium]|nr:TerB family tellurite resistance protein [Paludibacteraceae bacterium]
MGWLIGNPLCGMLVAAFAFFSIIWFLSTVENSDNSNENLHETHYSTRDCNLILFAEMMKADKENMKCELDKVKEYIRKKYNTEKDQTEALKQFKAILDDDKKPNLDDVYKTLNNHLSFQGKSSIIWNLLAIAYADDTFYYDELDTVKKISTRLNLLPSDYSAIHLRFMEEYRYNREFKGDSKDNESDFKYSILVLLAEVMNADGKLLTSELDRVKSTIRRYFHNESEQKIALKQFKAILENKHYIHDICKHINKLLNLTAKTEIIMELLAVAYADGIFNESEVSTINNIISELNLSSSSKSFFAIFLRKYDQGFYRSQSSSNQEYRRENDDSSNDKFNHREDSYNEKSESSNLKYYDKSLKESFDILGVNPDASDEEVKKAYRALAIQYHPDNAASLGDEAIRQATETMKQINVAWDVVKMARGIK